MASTADPVQAAAPPAADTKLKKAKAVKEPKAKKPAVTKKPKSSPSHPPFLQMITEAIVTLKEKTGSSQYAITKFTEEKQKQLPSNFRKLLLHHLKKLVASGKLVKVKNSFKLPPVQKPPTAKPKVVKAVKPKPKTAAKPKPKSAAKPKSTVKPKAAAAKPKAAVKPKAKAAKVARTTPGKKKVVKTVPAVAKGVKKLKSVKSPAKKAPAKKAKK